MRDGEDSRDLAPARVLAGIQPRFAPGIYFGLDEDAYHADPALGSTDIRRLRHTPYDWYWHSAYNQHRATSGGDDDEKQAVRKGDGREVGSAIHTLVLDGREAFDTAYVRRPGHIKKLTDAAAQKIAPYGEKVLHADDYDRAVIAGNIIIANPSMSGAFSGGFAEVSVFWMGEYEGRKIPLKCRFDYLRVRAIVDLKSIRNSRELPFIEACRRRIAEARYDIQAAHYMNGRRQMRAMVAAGAVHDCPDAALLRRIADSTEWAFAFVFFQADDAPLTWAVSMSAANPIIQVANDHIGQALANYVTCAERFGFDCPWLIAEPVEEFDINDLPQWAWR